MTTRTTPRLLAVSQIPPDLRAALAQRYELANYDDLKGASGEAPIAPGFNIAVTMGVYGANAALMDKLPDLQLIACNGAGLERIDLAEAKRRGIAVCHTPDELAEDVADGAIALTYAIMRRVVEADRFVRAGRWAKERIAPSRRLAGKTVGIVGLGRIGTLVAMRAEAIGMRVRYLGRRPKPDAPYPFVADILQLAAEADVLILSCPGGEATRNLVDRDVLERLGPDGYLVNVARGSVVDEAALIAALAGQEDRRRGARRVRLRAEPRSALSCTRQRGAGAALGLDHARDQGRDAGAAARRHRGVRRRAPVLRRGGARVIDPQGECS